MYIYPIPAFSDNYIWTIVDKETKNAVIVDPGDAKPVIEEFKLKKLNLTAILITHHHYDHTGGIKNLLDHYSKQKITVYGPKIENIPYLTHKLENNDEITLLNSNVKLKIISIPGHTLGHIAYFGNDLLFCGDTLFSAGCGKIFEGTTEQMFTSLQTLKNLPKSTKVYCGHEYTLNNLKFAEYIEKSNPYIYKKMELVNKKRNSNIPTLPSSIEEELLINPFLRTDKKEIQDSAKIYKNKSQLTEIEVFAAIREMKNSF